MLTGNEELLWRRHTAYHEAGHAVVGRVLTLACGGVTIEPDDDSAGHSITPGPWEVLSAWDKAGKWRDGINSAYRARIITYMAGAVAEEECLGFCQRGDGNDRAQIALMLQSMLPPDADAQAYDQRLRAKTRGLVRRHAHSIGRVAEALLKQTSLSNDEVEGFMPGANG